MGFNILGYDLSDLPGDISNIWDSLNDDKGIEGKDLAALLGLYGAYKGWGEPDDQKIGYQGKIPKYTAVRKQVPSNRQVAVANNTPEQWDNFLNATPAQQDAFLHSFYSSVPSRRPGEYGQRYFTDTIYAQSPDPAPAPPTVAEAQAQVDQQANDLNFSNMFPYARGGIVDAIDNLRNGGMKAKAQMPRPMPPPRPQMPRPMPPQAQGLGALAQQRGRPQFQNGPTDGMGDKVPIAASHGEFVVPSDVVSHLGNGNSEAGAQQLYNMMDRIRQARTGSTQQGRQINPNTFLPR